MPNTWKLGTIGLLIALMAGCEPSPEPRPEASGSVEAPVAATSSQQASATTDGAKTGRDIFAVAANTGEATPLLSARGSQTDAEVSPDGNRVAYESRVHGNPSQIFVLDADGTTRQLTHMRRGAHDPTWSPDGTQIAFAGTRRRDGETRFDSDIFVMNADGGRIRRLVGTPRPDGHPDWSPDGSQIAFHSRSGWTRSDVPLPIGLIWVVSVRTRTLGQLTPGHFPYGEVDPVWSPDGRWIAYSRFFRSTINGMTSPAQLWLMRSDGTRRGRLGTHSAAHSIENPSWSPNGGSIAFENGGAVSIIDVPAKRRRSVVPDALAAQPSWGPDGIVISLARADAATTPQATIGWRPTWKPSWVGKPDATIVLTGSRCEQVGGKAVLDPGALTFEFVSRSFRDATFKVVRVPPGRRLGDLRAGPFIGGWGDGNAPSSTDVWSSPRAVASGRWAVVCFKDLIAASNGFQAVPAGVAGPFEVG